MMNKLQKAKHQREVPQEPLNISTSEAAATYPHNIFLAPVPSVPEQFKEYEHRRGGLLSNNPVPVLVRINAAAKQINRYNEIIFQYSSLLKEAKHRLEYLQEFAKSHKVEVPEEEEVDGNL